MTTEKFVRRNRIIAQHIAEIALHREQIEAEGASQPFNRYFREVLGAQEHLLNAVERLLEQLPGKSVTAHGAGHAALPAANDGLHAAITRSGRVLPVLITDAAQHEAAILSAATGTSH
ncbi:MAG: hypothetical protein JWR07_3983 [Nevskia sp.]|nr:hypothetical protein [Nevskia sp.]